MSDVARHSRSRGLWIAIIVILAPAVVLPLIVPLYDKSDPRLGGWPFFFWFQMALIVMSTVLTAIAYGISVLADRRDREDRA
ncbi:MAG: DUF3311 domain-containing protein [Nocardioides sp.]